MRRHSQTVPLRGEAPLGLGPGAVVPTHLEGQAVGCPSVVSVILQYL